MVDLYDEFIDSYPNTEWWFSASVLQMTDDLTYDPVVRAIRMIRYRSRNAMLVDLRGIIHETGR